MKDNYWTERSRPSPTERRFSIIKTDPKSLTKIIEIDSKGASNINTSKRILLSPLSLAGKVYMGCLNTRRTIFCATEIFARDELIRKQKAEFSHQKC